MTPIESKVIAKLSSEGLSLISEWHLTEDCLRRVVSPERCKEAAQRLVETANQSSQPPGEKTGSPSCLTN